MFWLEDVPMQKLETTKFANKLKHTVKGSGMQA